MWRFESKEASYAFHSVREHAASYPLQQQSEELEFIDEGKGEGLLHKMNNCLIQLGDIDELRTQDFPLSSFEERRRSNVNSRTLNSNEDDHESIKIFTATEIEKSISLGVSIIGRWERGAVYKCFLRGKVFIVQMLEDSLSYKEFMAEVLRLKRLHHTNLVELFGYCITKSALVYKFTANGSLDYYMKEMPRKLSWKQRTSIIYQICLALNYLHSQHPYPLLHLDLQPENVLLDEYMNVKLAYFGKFKSANRITHESIRVSDIFSGRYVFNEAKSSGFMGYSVISDIHSLGKIILKVLTGMHPTQLYYKRMHDAYTKERQMRLVDETAGDWDKDVFKLLAGYCFRCCTSDYDIKIPLMTEMEAELGVILSNLGDCIVAKDINFQNLPHICYPWPEITSFDNKHTGESSKPAAAVSAGLSIRKNQSLNADMKIFSLKETEAMTDGFNVAMEIREGEFGKFYKGKLGDVDVAVKKIDQQGLNEFMKEMHFLAQMDNRNLVKLIGTCFACRALVYEYLSNGSVEDYITNSPQLFTWQLRTRTIYQICSALLYLHDRPQPFVHRNIKPDSIFLDDSLNAKLGDFGMCCSLPPADLEELSHVFVDLETIRGTMYTLPEYKTSGKVTAYCDLYSFGITILRIITGMHPAEIIEKMRTKDQVMMNLVDDKAGSWPMLVVELLIYFAVQCCSSKNFQIVKKMSVELPMLLNKFGITMQHEDEGEVLFSLDTLSKLNIKLFDKADIDIATRYSSLKLGNGGFGTVYKGVHDNVDIAVKILNTNNDQYWKDEFRREVEILGEVKHENLVKLIAVCLDPISLVYEYMPNKSVEHCLYQKPGELSWLIRLRIMYETCSILMCLHSKCIAHGDLKPDNILLDGNYKAKLSDFGLSRRLTDSSPSKVFIKTNVPKGTEDFIDPNYREQGILTTACDVYSFGVTILRLLITEGTFGIITKVRKAYRDKAVMDIVDSKAGKWPKDVSEIIAYHGLTCCSSQRSDPNMLQEISNQLKEILEAYKFI